MDNLDKLIDDLRNLLSRKYIEQYYLITSNLSVQVKDCDVLQNWICFLKRNNIESVQPPEIWSFIPTTEEVLVDLINKDQHKIKNKIIFKMQDANLHYNKYFLTTRENAQKLVILGSFEN
jgi:hypothetical protein